MLMLISAAGRQPPPESGSAAADAAAPGDGSKISLVFCIAGECNYFGPWQDCYCCGYDRKQNCHRTLAECRAHCAHGNPTCSPAAPTLAATTNATSYKLSKKKRYLVQLSSE